LNIPIYSGGGAVTSVFGRTSAVVANTGDYSSTQISGAINLAGIWQWRRHRQSAGRQSQRRFWCFVFHVLARRRHLGLAVVDRKLLRQPGQWRCRDNLLQHRRSPDRSNRLERLNRRH
jgi:hypothetical protein